jgi:hypothetical protein
MPSALQFIETLAFIMLGATTTSAYLITQGHQLIRFSKGCTLDQFPCRNIQSIQSFRLADRRVKRADNTRAGSDFSTSLGAKLSSTESNAIISEYPENLEYSGSSTLIPDDDKIPPPHPSRLPSERVEMTVANIRRREQIFQKYAEDIQGKTGLGAIAALQYVEGLVRRRDSVWGDLVMIVMKRKPVQVENFILRTAREVLAPPIQDSEWRWFRDNLLSTFVWFAPSTSSPGKYIYECLLDIARENIDAQASRVDSLRYPILEDAAAGGIFLPGGEDACRQDHPAVGLVADLGADVASLLSAENRRFYDLNVYLNKLICVARILDPEFQAAVAAVFEPLSPRPAFQPGPPKSLARCRAKAQADYAERAWPTAAHLLDVVRCSVTFDRPEQLLAALLHLIRVAPPARDGPREPAARPRLQVARVKNGFSAGPGGAGGRGYRDIKVRPLPSPL